MTFVEALKVLSEDNLVKAVLTDRDDGRYAHVHRVTFSKERVLCLCAYFNQGSDEQECLTDVFTVDELLSDWSVVPLVGPLHPRVMED